MSPARFLFAVGNCYNIIMGHVLSEIASAAVFPPEYIAERFLLVKPVI
jgi:hypothetical protein